MQSYLFFPFYNAQLYNVSWLKMLPEAVVQQPAKRTKTTSKDMVTLCLALVGDDSMFSCNVKSPPTIAFTLGR